MIAQDKYDALVQARLISHTGHAPSNAFDEILTQAGGRWAVLMECDDDGDPLPDEKWEARLYDDGSALIGTYVRGNRSTYFWKPIDADDLNAFDLWDWQRD